MGHSACFRPPRRVPGTRWPSSCRRDASAPP